MKPLTRIKFAEKIKKYFKCLSVFSGLIICLNTLTAQAQTIDYSITANFIYQFTKYFSWPVTPVNVSYTASSSSSADFVIGIIGNHELADYLQHTTISKKVGTQKIKVVEFTGAEKIYDCNILYVSNEMSKCLKQIITQNQTAPFLIVTEGAGLATKGSCVNLIVEDNKVKMEINLSNILRRNLKVASEFLGLGKVIQS